MIIHWLPLLGGLFFGFLPGIRLLNTECRYLAFEDFWVRLRGSELGGSKRRKWWKLPLVWIDPVRGFVAANLLMQAFEASAEAHAFERLLPTILGGALLMLAVFVQTCGRRDERETISPAGFLAGCLLALLPPMVAGAALIMGGATAVAMRSYIAGYILAALTTAGVGFMLMGKSPTLAIAAALTALPVLLNWLRGTRMVTPMRC